MILNIILLVIIFSLERLEDRNYTTWIFKYLKSYLVGLFGSLFYELKKPLETNKLFSLQKVKLKLFSLERDKNKKVFRTKTQKGPRGNFLDIQPEFNV